MRRLILGLALIGLASEAVAYDSDPPYLRGSYRWAGFYAGGQGGYSSAGMGFGNAGGSLAANIMRFTMLENEFQVSQWPNIPGRYTHGSPYGAFAGYNWQWNEVVLGVELNYNRGSVAATGTDSISRLVTASDDFIYAVTVATSASVRLTDFGTFRFRAGYVMEQFMPYVMAGLAVGRVSYTRSAAVGYPMPVYSLPVVPPNLPPPTPPAFGPVSQSESRGAFAYGIAVGGGVDIALLPNLFLRGEYEYIQFPSTGGIRINLNTARVGAGLKL